MDELTIQTHTIGITGSWLLRHWHGNKTDGEFVVPSLPLIGVGLLMTSTFVHVGITRHSNVGMAGPAVLTRAGTCGTGERDGPWQSEAGKFLNYCSCLTFIRRWTVWIQTDLCFMYLQVLVLFCTVQSYVYGSTISR
jgi:hypothetical protein